MKQYLLMSLGVVLLFLIFFAWHKRQFSDGLLHIVFCDVGQGDAILITTPERKQILLDGGPDASVLSCLSDHMPFWDRAIELVILSRPHADHLNGLIAVMERYSVKHFAQEPLVNDTAGYKELLKNVARGGGEKKAILAGDTIQLGGNVRIDVLGPTMAFLQKTSPKGTIGESSEFGSLISKLSYGNFDILFTGDSQVTGMKQAVSGSIGSFEVLHVPHHGSRFGLDAELMKDISPQVAVISLGKNNYGHPAPAILTLLQNNKVKYFRTDQDGEVEIISDGKKFWMK